MKKKTWIWITALVVVLGAGAYWAYRAMSADSYLHALPAHPKVLMAVDWSEVAEETGLGRDGLLAVAPGGTKLPEGIDWEKRTYVYVSDKEYIGLLAAVDDDGQLAEWFRQAARKGWCQEPEERNGYYWTVWDNSWMVGFDDRALLVMGPAVQAGRNQLRQEVTAALRQEQDKSGMTAPLFADVEKAEGSCILAARLDVLPEIYGSRMALDWPEHTNLSDVNLVAALRFLENGLTVQAEIRSKNEDINKYYEQLALLGKPIKGEYAAYVPQDAAAWFCMNTDGEKVLELLRKNPRVRTWLMGLNMGVDADLMLRSINGDVAVTFMPQALSQGNALLTARLEKTDFLKEAPYWKSSAAKSGMLDFRDFGNNRFYLGMGSLNAYFGVTGQTLYVTPDEALAEKVCTEKTSTLDEWKDEIKDSRFFLWGSLKQLGLLAGVPRQFNLFSDVVLRSSDARHFTIDLRGDSGQNVWKTLLK